MQPRDAVLIWRSGSEAGIVGIGRVEGMPRQMRGVPEEERFARVPDEEEEEVTRAPLRVEGIRFAPKEEVGRIREVEEHPIVVAPMGTEQELPTRPPLSAECNYVLAFLLSHHVQVLGAWSCCYLVVPTGWRDPHHVRWLSVLGRSVWAQPRREIR